MRSCRGIYRCRPPLGGEVFDEAHASFPERGGQLRCVGVYDVFEGLGGVEVQAECGYAAVGAVKRYGGRAVRQCRRNFRGGLSWPAVLELLADPAAEPVGRLTCNQGGKCPGLLRCRLRSDTQGGHALTPRPLPVP